MQTIAYTEARNQLTRLMDDVTKHRDPVVITRNGAGIAVLLAIEEYDAMEETLHLFSTPANAERIRRGLEDYANGNLQEHSLCD